MKNSIAGLIAAALLLVGAAGAQEADILITHARVISPPLPTIEDASIAIKDGRIVEIRSGRIDLTAKKTIDARGRAVVPGLIDTHVHFNIDPYADAKSYQEWVDAAAVEKIREYVQHGFTTILSVGDYWPGALQLRERLRRPDAGAPRFLISGPMISPRDGHGVIDFPACNAVPFCMEKGWFRQVDTAQQARELVTELAGAGVDGIKIAHDGTEITYNTQRRMGHFKPGVLDALITEAHRHRLPVMVHSYPVAYAREAVELGADALVHGPGLIRVGGSAESLDELLDLLVRKGVGMSTTLGVQTYIEDQWGIERDVPYGTTEFVEFLKAGGSMRRSLNDARTFFDRGVILAFGTDLIALRHPADAVQLEFAMLSKAGFSNAEILQIATWNAAKFLGRSQDLGSIEKSKLADLVIISADPLTNKNFLNRVDLVIREGSIIYDFEQ